jgi:hypothetical protein
LFSNCIGNEVLGVLLAHLLGREDRAGHAFDRRREVDLGAVSREQPLALLAHVVRQGEDEAVAAHCAHHREPDPRVPAGRLDQRGSWLEDPSLLGILHHGDRDPVLHAPAGVQRFHLASTTAPPGFGIRFSRVIGVAPTRSSTEPARRGRVVEDRF